MKFALASDLHLEFHPDGGKALVSTLPETEIIVVAGDLASAGCLWNSLMLLLQRYKHVIFVFGNHEFYGSNFAAVRRTVNKLKFRLPKLRVTGKQLGELHLLDNSTCEIDGQRFVGTTLWFPWEMDIEFKHNMLNDFYEIGGANPRIYEENRTAVDFLEKTVTGDDVVVTHHLPHEGSVHPRFKGSEYNCFYLCEMFPLISARQPKVWVHGHTHDSMDYSINKTRVLCNPYGYDGHEINPSFNSNFVFYPSGSTTLMAEISVKSSSPPWD